MKKNMKISLDMFKHIVEDYGDVYIMHNGKQVLIKQIHLDLYEKNGDISVMHQTVDIQGEFIKIEESIERIPFLKNGRYLFNSFPIKSSDIIYKILPIRTKNKSKILDFYNVPIIPIIEETDGSINYLQKLYAMLRQLLRTYRNHDESIFHTELFDGLDFVYDEEHIIKDQKHYDSVLNTIRQIHWYIKDRNESKNEEENSNCG